MLSSLDAHSKALLQWKRDQCKPPACCSLYHTQHSFTPIIKRRALCHQNCAANTNDCPEKAGCKSDKMCQSNNCARFSQFGNGPVDDSNEKSDRFVMSMGSSNSKPCSLGWPACHNMPLHLLHVCTHLPHACLRVRRPASAHNHLDYRCCAK